MKNTLICLRNWKRYLSSVFDFMTSSWTDWFSAIILLTSGFVNLGNSLILEIGVFVTLCSGFQNKRYSLSL